MSTIHSNASTEIDKYIDEMPAFAKAICDKLRTIILKADKEIVEDWKWGPNYQLNGMLCGYGAFKAHVKFTFFNGCAMKDENRLFNHCVDNEFSRSIKYTDVSEVDAKLITAYVKDSIAVNKEGFKRQVTQKEIETPADLQKALDKNKAAKKYFEDLSYGYKKEYVEHINSAKREETRNERIVKVVALCGEGRTLNDKYKK
ncbi:YdeI/OmpD-associated family protein [Danxiaibacter flavus]|uniref:YdeI/OmpD-associated family protein n=1 Tax=Danxiaibacter flavus TaxID=3049108 RepID=A0ABV3ZL29_9BACT|nr:YdeI/OmpD-associated family protein [Chitinophagaceae bacterium DXS]